MAYAGHVLRGSSGIKAVLMFKAKIAQNARLAKKELDGDGLT